MQLETSFWKDFSYCTALSSGKRCSSQLEQFWLKNLSYTTVCMTWCIFMFLWNLGNMLSFVVGFGSFVGVWSFFKLQSLMCNFSRGNTSNIIFVKITNAKSNNISSFSKSCHVIHIYARYSMNNKIENICITLHWCSLTSSIAHQYASLWTAGKEFLQSVCIFLSKVYFQEAYDSVGYKWRCTSSQVIFCTL